MNTNEQILSSFKTIVEDVKKHPNKYYEINIYEYQELVNVAFEGNGTTVDLVEKNRTKPSIQIVCQSYREEQVSLNWVFNPKDYEYLIGSPAHVAGFLDSLLARHECNAREIAPNAFFISFGKDYKKAAAVISEFIAKLQYQVTPRLVIEGNVCYTNRLDDIINIVSFPNGAINYEFRIADVRKALVPEEYNSALNAELEENLACQKRFKVTTVTYLAPKGTVYFNEPNSILTIGNKYYGGASQNSSLVISMPVIDNLPTTNARKDEIQKVLAYLSTIDGIRYMKPDGGNRTIATEEIQGQSLIIRCGNDVNKAASIVSGILSALGYRTDDLMIATIPG